MTPQSSKPADPGTPIGRVVELLAGEFEGVSVSKIRFLEAQGLVHPERRDSGIRVFAEEDIDRLRFVLTAQRDRFWPLRVIRDHLEQLDDRGDPGRSPAPVPPAGPAAEPPDGRAVEPPDGPAAEPPEGAAPGPPVRRRRTARVSAGELRESTGLDLATYGALKSFGLLRVDAAGRHGVDDVEIARQAAALASYGIEARHLRLFRVAADREIGLAEQVLEPLRRRRARGAPGPDPDRVQADMVARALALHTALVRAGLRASG